MTVAADQTICQRKRENEIIINIDSKNQIHMHFFSQRGPSFIKTLKWSELHARVPTHVLNETFHQLGLVFGLNDKYEPYA